MSEKQQQNQTHGYNSKAAEAIAAMPKDEQGLPVPNETAYNNSQVILEGDQEAMARSLEMQRYSEKAGKYAEEASANQHSIGEKFLKEGKSSEFIHSSAASLSDFTAKKRAETGKEERLLPVKGGMLTLKELYPDKAITKLDRSPASMRLSREKIREEAIKKAKEII